MLQNNSHDYGLDHFQFLFRLAKKEKSVQKIVSKFLKASGVDNDG